MDEKCHMEREEDKAEATKSKEKLKKSRVLISLKSLIYLQLPSCYHQNEGNRGIRPKYDSYYLFNQCPNQIFYQIRDTGLLRLPKPMRKYLNMKRNLKYYKFHEDFSHSTAECFSLREEIESFILSRCLEEFVANMRQANKSTEQDKVNRFLI